MDNAEKLCSSAGKRTDFSHKWESYLSSLAKDCRLAQSASVGMINVTRMA